MRLVDAPEIEAGYLIERTFSDRAWEGISALIDQIDDETARGLAEITAGAPIVGYAAARGFLEDVHERLAQPKSKKVDVGIAVGTVAVPVALLAGITYRTAQR